jgi:hypothetical protein
VGGWQLPCNDRQPYGESPTSLFSKKKPKNKNKNKKQQGLLLLWEFLTLPVQI